MAKFESLAHKWIDLSEYNYGISILNDSKYGFSVHENIMVIIFIFYLENFIIKVNKIIYY